MLNEGERVLVYPHGQKDRAAIGQVLATMNTGRRTTMIAFDVIPPFSNRKQPVTKQWAAAIILYRVLGPEGPVGPWIETANGGHYEVEELS